MPIYNLNYNLEFLDFIFLSPEFFLIFATLTIFLTMLFSDSNKFLLPTHEVSTEQQKTVIPTNVSFSFSLALTIISVFFVNVIYFNSYSIMYTNYTVFNNFFYGYFFIFFFKIFLTFIFFCYLIAVSNFSDQEFGFEFNFLLSIGFFSMQLFLSSCNLVSLYICLELQSFCFYIMAAYRKNSIFSSEAGLKFFILNSFSSVLILFGISAIYSVYGTFDLDIISSFLLFFPFSYPPFALIFGFVFLICGFLFKLAIVPFHSWLPDVYDGAPFIVTFFFSVLSKLPVFVVFLFVIQIFFVTVNFGFSKVLAVFAILSIVIGSFGALFQFRLKRFLAYASISQFGFILLTMSYNPTVSIELFLFYIITYTLLNLTLFCCFFGFYNPNYGRNLSRITDLKNIYTYNRSLAIILVLTLFSLAGIPPLAGFVSKYYLLSSLINFDQELVFILFFITLVSSVSVFYYLRLISIIFLEPDAPVFTFSSKTAALNSKKVVVSSFFDEQIFSSSTSYLFAFILVHLVYFNIFFILSKQYLFFFIGLLRFFFVCSILRIIFIYCFFD